MNKTFPTLYAKDSNDNTRIWYMEQKGNLYRTHSGVKDGQLVTSDWSTAEAKNIGKKNATTSSEQATAEIEAKYKKQLKTGYHEDEADAGLGTSYIEPMLAQTLHKLTKKPVYSDGNWAIQCKFNGNRCVASKDGLFSRKGERYMSVPHIEKALKPFFEKYPGAVLDGELFNNDLRQKLNEISELLRKKKVEPIDLENSEKLVRFYVYDGYGFNEILEENSKYYIRKEWIDTHVIGKIPYIIGVETKIVLSEEAMNEAFLKLLEDQQEGAMLRNINGGYEHKRSKNLVKVKVDDDSEAVILDITDGDGNWKGAATNVTLKWKNITFDAVFKGKYERRSEILKNKNQWVGKTVKFFYMGLTGLGTPNYARVDPDNCFSVDK